MSFSLVSKEDTSADSDKQGMVGAARKDSPRTTFLEMVVGPYADEQNGAVMRLHSFFLEEDQKNMYISSVTGQVAIPDSIYVKVAIIWIAFAFILPAVMPAYACRALLSTDRGSPAVLGASVAVFLSIVLCSASLVPLAYFTVTGRVFQHATYDEITFVEMFTPMGCSSLCSAALALHVLSVSVSLTAQGFFRGEVRDHVAHGIRGAGGWADQSTLDERGIARTTVKEARELIANVPPLGRVEDVLDQLASRFHVKGQRIFAMSRGSDAAAAAAGLTSFATAASIGLRPDLLMAAKLVLALVMAATPGWCSRLGVGSGLVLMARVAYAYTAFLAVFAVLTVSQSAVRLEQDLSKLLLLVLCISAPASSRRLLMRVYRKELGKISISVEGQEDVTLEQADVEYRNIEELSQEQSEECGLQQHDLTHPLQRIAVVMSYNLRRDMEENEEGGKGAVEELENFNVLDPAIFWLLRKKLKAYALAQSTQIQVFLMCLFVSAVGLSFVGFVLLALHHRLPGLMAIGVMLVVLVILLFAFNSIINLNLIMKEQTLTVMLGWKDFLERALWQMRTLQPAAQRRVVGMTFRGLLRRLDHCIQQIELSESPLSFFGIAITKRLRNSLIVLVLTAASQSHASKAVQRIVWAWLAGWVQDAGVDLQNAPPNATAH